MRRWAIAAVIGLQIADILTTWHAVHNGYGREGNPLMITLVHHHLWIVALVKALWVGLFVWYVSRIPARLATIGIAIVLLMTTAVIVSNVRVMVMAL